MEVNKDKWMRFIDDGKDYSVDCGKRPAFTPSQLIAAGEMDTKFDELFTGYENLLTKNTKLEGELEEARGWQERIMDTEEQNEHLNLRLEAAEQQVKELRKAITDLLIANGNPSTTSERMDEVYDKLEILIYGSLDKAHKANEERLTNTEQKDEVENETT